MEDRLFFCGIILLAIIVTGSNAQIDVCGVAPLSTKIVGGQNASPGSWPWQAGLQQNGNNFCGGSLINNQYVLTAAHCFPSPSTNGLVVYLGRQDQQGVNSNEVSISVSQIIKHPNYDSSTQDNDIALLQLSSTVTFTDYINPVCLAASDSNVGAGTICWVTGWGNINTNQPLPGSQTLQEVSVPIVPFSNCTNDYNNVMTITNNMICAGVPQGGEDACQGDSGGPLVVKNNIWVQAGVVSFGHGCGLPNFPGVYARVSQYQSWINSQISSNQPGFVTLQTGDTTANSAAQVICLSVLTLLHVAFSFFVLS